MRTYWFKPKRYGLGAVPANWKGWVCSFVPVVLVLALPPLWAKAAVAAAFVALAWIKTEGGWRWRWGEEKQR
jgi:hypothetical protein